MYIYAHTIIIIRVKILSEICVLAVLIIKMTSNAIVLACKWNTDLHGTHVDALVIKCLNIGGGVSALCVS